MSKLGWLAGGWEETSFKRVPDGWLFSFPFIWSRRTYLVTDEQKVLLSKPLRRAMWGGFLALMALIFVVTSFGRSYNSLAYWAALIVLGPAIMLLSWAYLTLATRPLLAGLAPTQRRITYGDKFKLQATNLPTALIIIGVLFSLMLFAMGITLGLTVKWDATAIFCTVFFAILAAYWVAVFIAQRKINRSTTMTSR